MDLLTEKHEKNQREHDFPETPWHNLGPRDASTP